MVVVYQRKGYDVLGKYVTIRTCILCGGRKMEINLSEEMIEKITYVSAGRLSDLKAKEEAVKNSMAVGETQIRRKRMQLKDIEKAKTDAGEVHALFF